MNKYDRRLFEVATEVGVVHELLRRPIRSRLFKLVDLMFDNIGWTFDGLSSKGAYYLVITPDRMVAMVYHIDRNLEVTTWDVTSVVQAMAGKKSFEFEGYRYKLYRRIKH